MLDNTVIEPGEAGQILTPFLNSASPKIALAVSGGADSMALLWMASRCRDPSSLLVLTVDHGLRNEAAAEAESVKTWCAEHGITHRTLSWQGEKPQSGVQEEARKARYRLMAEACEREGAEWLLTAHNADDQAETVFARLARGSGVAGLAAMKPFTQIAAGAGAPVMLARPLLAVPRARLRATAKARNVPFFDDPGNDDVTYERIRRRAFLAAIEAQDLLEKSMLLTLSRRMQRAADMQEDMLQQDFQATGGFFHGTAAICLEQGPFMDLSQPRQTALIGRAAEAVSGSDYPPDPDSLENITHQLKQTDAQTIGGALIRRSEKKIWVMREPAALLGRQDGGTSEKKLALTGEKKMLWDNRLIVNLPAPALDDGYLAPIGIARSGPLVPKTLAASLPALLVEGEFVAVPDYAKKILAPADSPWKRGTSTLDINLLTKERFNRRVVRF